MNMSESDKKPKRRAPVGTGHAQKSNMVRPRPSPLRGFASCPRGLEELLADELKSAGIESARPTAGGASFNDDLESLYRACLWSRVASRVMLSIAEVDARDADELYRGVVDQPWEQHITEGSTLAIDFIGTSDELRNSQFSARRVKDGIVDRLRRVSGTRPDVELRDPDLRIIARLHRGRCTLSLDFSGSALHRRGYRQATGAAPLKENLAAAILLRAGWPSIAASGGALVDPLCGSGTLLIEAALMAADAAPGLARELTPRRWPNHDSALWQMLLDEARARSTASRPRPVIIGADADWRVVERAQDNVAAAGLQDWIRIETQRFDAGDLASGLSPGLMVCNPPYGERIGSGDDAGLTALYNDLGATIKTQFADWQAAVLTADGPLTAELGLRWDKQYAFRNGAIDCKLLVFGPVKQERTVVDPYRTRRPPPIPEMTDDARMVANRIRKNMRRLKSWLKSAETDCYRVYDADIPEYAVAIDRFGNQIHLAEYAAPATIEPALAQKRLDDVRAAVADVFDVGADQIVLKTRSRQRGASQYQRQDRQGEMQQVHEGPATLLVNLRDYLDTGLFLDHRKVRRMVADLAKGKRLLNLFCYTASVSVQAALAGASDTLSVDMSATYLDWAEQNLRLNQLDRKRHRVLRADCLSWMKEQRSTWDVIFLDPPSFSNSKRMETTLDIQRDHVDLIQHALALLAPNGTLVFSTNRRGFKMDYDALPDLDIADVTAQSYDPDFERGRTKHAVFMIRYVHQTVT